MKGRDKSQKLPVSYSYR